MARRVLATVLLVGFLVIAVLRAGPASAETPAPHRVEQDKGIDCVEDSFLIDETVGAWKVYTNGAAEEQAVADLLVTGGFLMGCEDEFPRLDVLQSNQPMGSLTLGDIATNSNPQAIALATIDTLSSAEQFNLSIFYGFSWTWWNALDDAEDEQAYLVAFDQADEKILIVGATQQGLQYGVVDFLKSLDRVDFAVSSGVYSWSPDPISALTSGLTSECEGSVVFDPIAGEWDEATEAQWCPQQALNHPDVSYRMGFPGFNGARGSNFISNVLEPSLIPDCASDSGIDPETEAQDWFAGNVVNCDRTDAVCLGAQRRLDALVWGKFTHALDESYAQWQSLYLEDRTGCDPAYLYRELWSYLGDREVSLVPSAFGLESRTIEEPVGGRWNDGGPEWAGFSPASEWGKLGNFKNSEGLSVIRKEFQACSVSAGDYLSPAADPSYADSGVDPCVDYVDPATGVAISSELSVMIPVDWDAVSPSTTPGPWVVSSGSGAFVTGVDFSGNYGMLNTSSSALTVTVPVNSTTADRLYVVGFHALISSSDDISGRYRVTGIGGGTGGLRAVVLGHRSLRLPPFDRVHRHRGDR
ncbi:MAG: hypothetical protein GY871_02035 [Actinomycetales bacterium]|nr:hypothetical protein [Actinomycetales bacterium]